ncbi:Crp/Fnr family transcriptional regulator [Aureibacter tunicatorum]|uniref:CRP-like cAMP-binding protein n=1 Tax=Aureibacter tunicatorum TaxID=866807 RepID=A0AAE3XN17_9BACT|nr:Crp/Fnr family transcriptional regulator [Aureibacter tunicatorum]MDR6239510.1 CRP-like cAMP-binding protein [Aureibacter tunicatorum]BDD03987.1 cyclic nucleotide-binding protein [Aureibacter tunicatorum]
MNSSKDLFQHKYEISGESFELLNACMSEESKSKGELLIKVGEIHNYIYFIKTGAMRSYFINKDGKEVTYWFGFEGDIAASLSNFIKSKPSMENIELLEDSVILKISRSKLLELYETNLELANFGRKIAEKALLEMEEQILLTQFTDAKSRYLKLINRFPEILQRVKLGHISSYLGITQVTLSRIRSGK